MKRLLLLFVCLAFYSFSVYSAETIAPDTISTSPDTVSTGIYVTSIHNIDFRQKEYVINLWVWFKYRNPEFDFTKNIELPQAKTMNVSYTTVDTLEDGRFYVLMKLQCTMKDTWKIDKFPFDRQILRLSIENSQYDSSALVFAVDTVGEYYGKFTISGWTIEKDSFKVSVRNQPYQTAFGDPTFKKPYSAYSSYRVKIGVTRDSPWVLFWKLFLGMFVSFLIAYSCFYIHVRSIESRFGLCVGSLFAAVGNKYIVDSALPDTSAATLVDTLHGITLVFIFAVIASTIYALSLAKKNNFDQANRFDKIVAQVLGVTYIVLNIYFISKALT